MFDSGKTGKIEKEKVRTILNTLGHTYDDQELDALLTSEDTEGKNRIVINNYKTSFNPIHPSFFCKSSLLEEFS